MYIFYNIVKVSTAKECLISLNHKFSPMFSAFYVVKHVLVDSLTCLTSLCLYRTHVLINMWICRKLISEVSKERYTKTQKYNQIYKR